MATLYKLEDVARNDGKNGTRCWIVIRDTVYDVTDYLDNVSFILVLKKTEIYLKFFFSIQEVVS